MTMYKNKQEAKSDNRFIELIGKFSFSTLELILNPLTASLFTAIACEAYSEGQRILPIAASLAITTMPALAVRSYRNLIDSFRAMNAENKSLHELYLKEKA